MDTINYQIIARIFTSVIILRPLLEQYHQKVGVAEEIEAEEVGEGEGMPGGRLITGVDIKTTKTAENLSSISELPNYHGKELTLQSL